MSIYFGSEVNFWDNETYTAFIEKINTESGYGPTVKGLSVSSEIPLTDNDFKTIVKRCPNIQSLTLDGKSCSLSERGFKKIRKLTHLEDLCFSKINDVDIIKKIFSHIKDNDIRSITFSETEIDNPEKMSEFCNLKGIKAKTLTFWRCKIDARESIAAISNLEGSNVKTLLFSECNIDTIEQITEIRNLKDTNVKTLILRKNNINKSQKITALSAALIPTKINSLNIDNNGISDYKEVINLVQNNPKLKYIYLKDNHISKNNLKLIDEAIKANRENREASKSSTNLSKSNSQPRNNNLVFSSISSSTQPSPKTINNSNNSIAASTNSLLPKKKTSYFFLGDNVSISLKNKDDYIAFSEKIKNDPEYGPTIREIDQHYDSISDDDFITIVKQCPNIEYLRFYRSSSLTENGFKEMRNLTKLKSITIDKCRRNIIESIFKHIKDNNRIDYLTLENITMNKASRMVDWSLLKSDRLWCLGIHNCKINVENLKALCHLKNTSMVNIELSSNNINTAELIKELCNLKNTNIKSLSLDDNDIDSPEAIAELCNLKETNIKSLSLKYNTINTPKKIAALSTAIKATKINSLGLSYNGISDLSAILELIQDNPQLTNLGIKTGNHLSEDDLKLIHEALKINEKNQTLSLSNTNLNTNQPSNQVVQPSPVNDHLPEKLNQFVLEKFEENKGLYSKLQSQLLEMQSQLGEMQEAQKSTPAPSRQMEKLMLKEIQDLQSDMKKIEQANDKAVEELADELKSLIQKQETDLKQYMAETKKEARELYQTLCGVKGNVDDLVLNHKKIREIEAEQDFLNNHPRRAVRNFYRIATTKLAASLLAIEMHGKVSTPNTFASNSADGLGGALNAGARTLASIGDFGSAVPMVGAAVMATGKAIKIMCDAYEDKKIHNAEKVVSVIPPKLCTRILAEEAIRLVSYRYIDTIAKLDPKAAKEFAEKVSNKMVFALRQDEIRMEDIEAGKSLAEQLMMVISTFSMKQNDVKTPIFRIPLPGKKSHNVTKDNKQSIESGTVTDEGILRKTGLKQLNTDGSISLFYKLPAEKNKLGMKRNDKEKKELGIKAKNKAESYGYRWATADECKGSLVCFAGTIAKKDVKISIEEERTAHFINGISYVKKSEAKAREEAIVKSGKKEAKTKGIPYVEPDFDEIRNPGSKKNNTNDDKPKESEVNKKITDYEVKTLIDSVAILKEKQEKTREELKAELREEMRAEMQAQMEEIRALMLSHASGPSSTSQRNNTNKK